MIPLYPTIGEYLKSIEHWLGFVGGLDKFGDKDFTDSTSLLLVDTKHYIEAVNNYERIVKERDELKEICREAYEVWAGSEIGEPVYASEAYAIKIIKDMVEIVSKGLTKSLLGEVE